MQKRNTSLTVSPIEQMYFLNRTNGLGDPIASAIISIGQKVLSAISSLFGGGGDPYKDVHIPAQAAAESGMSQVLNLLATKQANGSLTYTDLQQAVSTVQTIDNGFRQLTSALSGQHPKDASRYQAGYNDIHNLASNVIASLTPQKYGISAPSGITGAIQSITSSFTNPGGGISTAGIGLLIAGFFIAPMIMKSLKR